MKYYNIGDAIIKTIVTTDYTKKKLNKLIIFILTFIFRSFINTVAINILCTGVIYIDSLINIFLSIIFILNTNTFLQYIELHKNYTLLISSYLIENYSPENFRKWKKYVVVVLCIIMIVYLMIFEITSKLLIQSIIEFLICYFIVDTIENKNGFIYERYTYAFTKKSFKVYKKGDIFIIDDYKNISENNISKKNIIFDESDDYFRTIPFEEFEKF